jgi:hypothetical protein
MAPGINPRALRMPGKCSDTERHLSPFYFILGYVAQAGLELAM